MNTLISRILILARPSRPEVYRAYLERMPTCELQQKLRDLEQSEHRSGNGYCPLRGLKRYEDITAIPTRTTVPAEGQGRTLAPA